MKNRHNFLNRNRFKQKIANSQHSIDIDIDAPILWSSKSRLPSQSTKHYCYSVIWIFSRQHLHLRFFYRQHHHFLLRIQSQRHLFLVPMINSLLYLIFLQRTSSNDRVLWMNKWINEWTSNTYKYKYKYRYSFVIVINVQTVADNLSTQ